MGCRRPPTGPPSLPPGCCPLQLIGTIPKEIGAMERLRVLRLEYNSLHGTIPDTFK